MNDEGLQEPAASWAGVEAVISLWLAGDTRAAEAATSSLQEHVKMSEPASDSGISVFVNELAGDWMTSNFKPSGDRMILLQKMAVALKNWELGAWDAAMPLFQAIKKIDLPEKSPLVVYKDISEKYLADYDHLQGLAALPNNPNKSQIDKYLAGLKKIAGGLKTKGRAKYHIQVWQVRAERHLEKLERLRRSWVQNWLKSNAGLYTFT